MRARWDESDEIHHSFSAGIATTKVDVAAAQLIDQPIRALTWAKDSGKNRVTSLNPTLRPQRVGGWGRRVG